MSYISFKDVANGRGLYDLIKQRPVKTTIAPAPGVLDVCCGISILYDDSEDKPKIEKTVEEGNIEIRGFHEMERDVNPNRMKSL